MGALGKATSGRESQWPLRDRGLEKTADPARAGHPRAQMLPPRGGDRPARSLRCPPRRQEGAVP